MSGRTAFITGAGSGVGAAVAEELARAGMQVALVGRTLAKCAAMAGRIHAAGGTALALAAEVADPEQVRQAVARTVERFGGVDVLVNSAGVHSGRRLLETTDQEWSTVIGSSLTGAFNCSRECLRVMREQGRGHIITIASQAAGYAGPWECAYGMAKAGQVRLTLHLLSEMAQLDQERTKAGLPPGAFAAHVLCPGAIDTPLRAGFAEPAEARARMLRPQELAAVVRLLVEHPESGRSAVAERFAGAFQVGSIGLFEAHEAIIRLWR